MRKSRHLRSRRSGSRAAVAPCRRAAGWCWGTAHPGAIEALATRIVIHVHHCDEARKAAVYFRDNRARLRCAAFRNAGLCTSSGVIEAGCKSVIGRRLQRPGMRWSVHGADAITALRCAVLSNRLDAHLTLRQPSSRAAA